MPRKSSLVSLGGTSHEADSMDETLRESPRSYMQYVLPEGQRSCPIPECSYYNKTFDPHWRLNEHMKKRHNWPRKMTQPNTDRRRSGAQRSANYPRKYKKRKPKDSAEDEGVHHKRIKTTGSVNGVALDHSTLPKFTHNVHEYHRSFDSDVCTGPADSEVLAAVNSLTRESSPLSSASSEGDTMELRSRKPNATPSKAQDTAMVAEIESYVKQLRNMAAPASPDTGDTRADPASMAEALQSLLTKSQIQVNTIVPRTSSSSLSPLYKALADRATRQAAARLGRVVFVGGLVEGEPISAPVSSNPGQGQHKEQSKSGLGKYARSMKTISDKAEPENGSLQNSSPLKPSTPGNGVILDKDAALKKVSLKLNFTPSSPKSSKSIRT